MEQWIRNWTVCALPVSPLSEGVEKKVLPRTVNTMCLDGYWISQWQNKENIFRDIWSRCGKTNRDTSLYFANVFLALNNTFAAKRTTLRRWSRARLSGRFADGGVAHWKCWGPNSALVQTRATLLHSRTGYAAGSQSECFHCIRGTQKRSFPCPYSITALLGCQRIIGNSGDLQRTLLTVSHWALCMR